MKVNVFLLVLGLSASAAATRLRVAMSSEATAAAWVRGHPAPQADELAELKDENPDAYALVKALLTKRSLGLLDPRHPTASFANGPKPVDQAVPTGAAAYAALTTPKDQEIEARSANAATGPEAPDEVQAVPEHHITDMFAWRPSSSATSDDAEVQNVLGAVANLKQSSPASPPVQGEGGSLDADSHLFDGEAAAPAAPAARPSEAPPSLPVQVQEPAPEPQGTEENHYLKGLDLTAGPSKGADLSSDMKMFEDTTSTSDSAPPAPSTAAPTAAAAAKPDALSSWLGVKKVVQKAPSKQAAPAPPSNPYMVDWNN